MDAISTDVIRKFDPWRSNICTCPDKYSFNPYTGCGHGCIYCYATYIPNFYHPRRKKDLMKRTRRDLEKIPSGSIISISNSSDPYIPMDQKYKDTRKCLQLFRDYNLRILIITKSDLVLRDIDLLQKLNAAVTFTITTLEEDIYRKLEPQAPEPEKRLNAIKELTQAGIPTGVRLDPVFLYLTDKEIEKIVKEAKKAGAKHIVTSTFKPKYDGWKRFQKAFPENAENLKSLYFKEGERIGNAWYLPIEIRRNLMSRVKKECLKYNITFATCREGFEMNVSETCDGSHLIK
jgi:DNA repair photolyase